MAMISRTAGKTTTVPCALCRGWIKEGFKKRKVPAFVFTNPPERSAKLYIVGLLIDMNERLLCEGGLCLLFIVLEEIC